jgi:FAD:protein FMN transferase
MSLQTYSLRFEAMGSKCSFTVCQPPKTAIRSLRAASSEVHRIEGKFSRYLPASVTSQINRSAGCGDSIQTDDETAALIDYAFQCYEVSGGLFDITSGVLRYVWDFRAGRVPDVSKITEQLPKVGLAKLIWERPILRFPVKGMELDFGGLAKEYAADRAVAICHEYGLYSGVVDLGGDMAVIGPRPDGLPWTIGISNPKHPEEPFAVIALNSGALATSGDYVRYSVSDGKRYSHILNPLTGWPMEELSTVSVLSDHCLAAGSFSTIAMLKGDAGLQWLDRSQTPYAWMTPDGRSGCTSPFSLVRSAR